MQKTKNYAYITLLSNNLYIYYVLGLYYSWQQTKSKYPFYCIVNEDVTDEIKQILKQINCPIIEISTIDLKNELKKVSELTPNRAFQNGLIKLKIFSLEQFDKCVYLDSDMLINENIDELFNFLPFSAVEDIITDTYKDKFTYINGMSTLNGGLLVFEPSLDFYNKVVNSFKVLPDMDLKLPFHTTSLGWHDQSILAYHYQDWMQHTELHLPVVYNFLMNTANCIKYASEIPKIKVKHFVNDKINILMKKPINIEYAVYNSWVDYLSLINEILLRNNILLPLIDCSYLKPLLPR